MTHEGVQLPSLCFHTYRRPAKGGLIGELTKERPYSPTRLDKIENFRLEANPGSVGPGLFRPSRYASVHSKAAFLNGASAAPAGCCAGRV